MNQLKVFFAFLIFRLAIIFFVSFAKADTRQDLARDVVGAQFEHSQYIMSVTQGEVYNAEIDKALGIEIGNACFRLVGNDGMRMCVLNVAYQTGIPFNFFKN